MGHKTLTGAIQGKFWGTTRCFFENCSSEVHYIEANKGGGEDIIFSYIVSSLTKRRPLVIPAGYNNKELPQIDALHNRFPDVHKQGRTDIMRLCQEKLKI